jgi:hypothetical protein
MRGARELSILGHVVGSSNHSDDGDALCAAGSAIKPARGKHAEAEAEARPGLRPTGSFFLSLVKLKKTGPPIAKKLLPTHATRKRKNFWKELRFPDRSEAVAPRRATVVAAAPTGTAGFFLHFSQPCFQ